MASNSTSLEELTAQLQALNVEPGRVLVVHSSFSRVAPVAGGPRGLIAGLPGEDRSARRAP